MNITYLIEESKLEKIHIEKINTIKNLWTNEYYCVPFGHDICSFMILRSGATGIIDNMDKSPLKLVHINPLNQIEYYRVAGCNSLYPRLAKFPNYSQEDALRWNHEWNEYRDYSNGEDTLAAIYIHPGKNYPHSISLKEAIMKYNKMNVLKSDKIVCFMTLDE